MNVVDVPLDVLRQGLADVPAWHMVASRLRDDWAANFDFWRNHVEYKFFRQWCPDPCRVLDIGFGFGFSDLLLAAAGFRVVGTEPDPIAYRATLYLSSFQTPEVQKRFEPVAEIPAKDSYDVIWLSHVIEHMTEQQCRETFAKLRGKMLVATPLAGGYSDPSDMRVFMQESDLVVFLESFGLKVNWCHAYKEGILRAEVLCDND